MNSTATLRRAASALDRPKVVPLDDRHPEDHVEYRQRRGSLTERAVEVDGAPGGQRRDQLRESLAADWVEGDACALAVSDALHFGDQILLFCRDDVDGASFEQRLPLLRGARERNRKSRRRGWQAGWPPVRRCWKLRE